MFERILFGWFGFLIKVLLEVFSLPAEGRGFLRLLGFSWMVQSFSLVGGRLCLICFGVGSLPWVEWDKI